MEKFKTILLIITTNLITAFTFSIFPMLKEEEKKDLGNDNLAVFVETSDGSGEYTLSSMSGLPADRKYIYNSEKSSCINGGVLTWNDTTRKLSVTVTSSDACNTYFNIDETGPTISNVEVTDTTQTSITVKVTASDRSGIDMYYYSINDGAYISSTSNTHTFSSLKAGTSYIIKIYATDSIGTSSSISSNNFKTTSPPVGTYLKNTLKPTGLNTSMEGGLYRFQGTVGNVNNYICFGTTDKTKCTQDTDKYMYRILGINSNEQLKLIKNEALNVSYQWHSADVDITWPNSDLFNGINSNYFLNNSLYMSSTWSNKIATTEWKYGEDDSMYYDTTAADMYSIEDGWQDKISAKIGLIYLYDYQYSYQSGGYDKNATSDIRKKTWLFIENCDSGAISSYEWTISRYGYFSRFEQYQIYYINPDAIIVTDLFTIENPIVRPVFYLTTDVSYLGGTGTLEDPIMIE